MVSPDKGKILMSIYIGRTRPSKARPGQTRQLHKTWNDKVPVSRYQPRCLADIQRQDEARPDQAG